MGGVVVFAVVVSVFLNQKKSPQPLRSSARIWSGGSFLPSPAQSHRLFCHVPKLTHLLGILHPKEAVSKIGRLPRRGSVFLMMQKQQNPCARGNGFDSVGTLPLLGESPETRQLDGS